MCRFGKAKELFETLRLPVECAGDAATIDPRSAPKACNQKTLNHYVNPILQDMDPDQGIEDEYKQKHNQIFCWRFLRAVSYFDQSLF